jgi:ribonuclease Z
MSKLVILGTSNAVPGLERENTYFLVENGAESILIDCGVNAFSRLQGYGKSIHEISDIILTHFHPDHVTGLPLLLMDWWLLGRTAPLTIHGLPHTLERTKTMMDLFDWRTWPGFFHVNFNVLPESMMTVLEKGQVLIKSMPVRHLIPTIGIRVALKDRKKSIAYSCDTESCEAVVELARDADLLIHEAAGEARGHSSAGQSGMDANRAKAKKLMLIHYPAEADENGLLKEAKKMFGGKVSLARDGMQVD